MLPPADNLVGRVRRGVAGRGGGVGRVGLGLQRVDAALHRRGDGRIRLLEIGQRGLRL